MTKIYVGPYIETPKTQSWEGRGLQCAGMKSGDTNRMDSSCMTFIPDESFPLENVERQMFFSDMSKLEQAVSIDPSQVMEELMLFSQRYHQFWVEFKGAARFRWGVVQLRPAEEEMDEPRSVLLDERTISSLNTLSDSDFPAQPFEEILATLVEVRVRQVYDEVAAPQDVSYPGDTLTVLIRDLSSFIHLQQSPDMRSVQVKLTPEQLRQLALRPISGLGDRTIYEEVASCFIEPREAQEAEDT